MRLKIYFSAILLVVSILVGDIIYSQSSNSSDILRDFLTDNNCNAPCIYGIEPLVTTYAEAITIIEDVHGSNYTWTSVNQDDTGLISWIPPTYPPLSNTSLISQSLISVNNGIVTQLTLPVTASLSTIRSAFGEPNVIRISNESRFYIVYQNKDIVFHFDTSIDTVNSTFVSISHPSSLITMANNGPGEIVDQPCMVYGTPPCIVPTALPNQAPISNAGADQTVSDATDTALVTLDGSASSDTGGSDGQSVACARDNGIPNRMDEKRGANW